MSSVRWRLNVWFAWGIAHSRWSHGSFYVFMVLFYMSIAWVSLLFRFNVQESFSCLLKLSKFSYLPPLVFKILLSSIISYLHSFLILFRLSHFFYIFVVFFHVPFFKFFSIFDASLNPFFVSDLVLLKLWFQFFLLRFNKFNLHGKFKFFELYYLILLCFLFPR